MNEGVAAPGYLLEGKYKIVGLVGEGAWGQVLEGLNVRIQRKVAIKILKAEYASNPAMVARFEREALASTHIESPHVVQVFDAGLLADGRPYLVMEFLTGEDLGTHIIRARRLPVVTAVELCAQVARGLAAAHTAGVFHRDMKPSNIVIAKTKSGGQIAKIVDFGISKLLDVSKPAVSHTQTGTVLGSPVYMSPEQARGSKTTDHRSDLYSLGVVLFECLTGTTPHQADGFNELLFRIVLEPSPTVGSLRPEVCAELDSIVQRLLAKDPERRVQTASELEALLVAWLVKNGVKLSESPTESGPRLVLTDSPVFEGASARLAEPLPVPSKEQTPLNLQATVPVGALSEPALPASDPSLTVRSAEVVAQGVPAASPSSDALLGAPPPPAASAPAPSRRAYVIGGVLGLALLVGVVAMTAGNRRTPIVAGSTAPSTGSSMDGRPLGSAATPSTSVATAPDIEAAGAAVSASAGASASASAAMSAKREPGRSPAFPALPVTAASAGRPKPAVSARASAEAPPAATSVGSASVGGRTIRTEL